MGCGVLIWSSGGRRPQWEARARRHHAVRPGDVQDAGSVPSTALSLAFHCPFTDLPLTFHWPVTDLSLNFQGSAVFGNTLLQFSPMYQTGELPDVAMGVARVSGEGNDSFVGGAARRCAHRAAARGLCCPR